MKKLITIVLLFFTLYAFGQDKGYVALSIGGAVPLEKFGTSDINDGYAGYAKLGGIVDLSFNYKLFKNFGFSSILRAQFNPTKSSKLNDQLNTENSSPGVSYNTKINTWAMQSLMVGAYYSLPIGDKFSIHAKAMLGVSNSTRPTLEIDATYFGTSFTYTQHAKNAQALSYLLGLGAQYNLNSKLCLLLNVDYTSTNPTYKNVEFSITGQNSVYQDISLKLQSVNASVGIGIRL